MTDANHRLFPPLSEAEWKQVAEKSLKGKSFSDLESPRVDGLDLPLWTRRVPSISLPERSVASSDQGMPWEIQESVADPAQLMQGLLHGVSGVRISPEAFENHGLHDLLDGVHLDMIDLHLDGPEASGLLRELIAIAKERNCGGGKFKGACSLDLTRKDLASDAEKVHRHVMAWGAAFPKFRTWGADAVPWLESGMNAVDAMALMLLAVDHHWPLLTASSDLLPEDLLGAAVLQWSVGSEVLVEAAALRALRVLWSMWLEDCGLPSGQIWLDARTSPIRFESSKPEDNLLRCTASGYAAALGGADGIEVLPHTHRTERNPSASARRYARNVQHLLIEESRIHKTFDPLQGSRWVGEATQQFVDAAWKKFTALRGNSVIDLSENGTLQTWIENGRKARMAEGMFRPHDAEGELKTAVGTIEWDERGLPRPWFLVSDEQSEK